MKPSFDLVHTNSCFYELLFYSVFDIRSLIEMFHVCWINLTNLTLCFLVKIYILDFLCITYCTHNNAAAVAKPSKCSVDCKIRIPPLPWLNCCKQIL